MTLLAITVVQTKIPWYVVPFFSFNATVIADAAITSFRRSSTGELLSLGLAAALTLLDLQRLPSKGAIAGVIVLALAGWAFFAYRSATVPILLACVFVADLPVLLAPYHCTSNPMAQLALTTRRYSDASPLLMYSTRRIVNPVMIFYSGRCAEEVSSFDRVVAEVRRSGCTDVVTWGSDLPALGSSFDVNERGRESELVYARVCKH